MINLSLTALALKLVRIAALPLKWHYVLCYAFRAAKQVLHLEVGKHLLGELDDVDDIAKIANFVKQFFYNNHI